MSSVKLEMRTDYAIDRGWQWNMCGDQLPCDDTEPEEQRGSAFRLVSSLYTILSAFFPLSKT